MAKSCSIIPINPLTNNVSTLYPEILSKYGSRNVAIQIYGELFKNNPSLFSGVEPNLNSVQHLINSKYNKKAPIVSTGTYQVDNGNQFIKETHSQATNWIYDQTSEKYTNLNNGKEGVRVSAVIQHLTGRDKTVLTSLERATKQADELWKGLNKSDRKNISINGSLKSLDYNDFLDTRTKQLDFGILKGNAIHSWLQFAATGNPQFEKDALDAEAQTAGLGVLGGSIDQSWAFHKHKTIFKNAGLRTEDYTDPVTGEVIKADYIFPELQVGSELLNIVGTADMVAYHPDGSMSILDWKTGSSFNDNNFTKILNYGVQNRLISDNPKDRAKLQLAMYAFLIKLNNPDAKFKNLKAIHLPNSFSADFGFKEADVDVTTFIPMIEQMFKSKAFLEEIGLPLDTIKTIKQKSPRVFNALDYTMTPDSLHQQISRNGIESTMLDKMNQIKYLSAKKEEPHGLSKPEEKLLAGLSNEVLEMENFYGFKLGETVGDSVTDLGFMSRWTANYMDTNNEYLKIFKTIQDKRVDEATAKYSKVERRFNSLMKAVFKEHGEYGTKIGSSTIFTDVKAWDWAYREDVDVDGNLDLVLITEDDVAEWSKLSNSQQELLKFVIETQDDIFTNPDSHMNKTAYKNGSDEYTTLEYYNKQVYGSVDGFKYKKGWFPKTLITDKEFALRNKGSIIKRMKEYIFLTVSDYIDNNFEGRQQSAIPLRYLGNPGASREYNSRNLEQNFLSFMKAYTLKESLDDVYALGEGIKSIHSLSENKAKNKIFGNTLGFISDKMMMDLVGRPRKDKLLDSPLIQFKDGSSLDLYRLTRLFKSLMSFSVLGFSTSGGIKNALFATMINQRNGIVNWSAEKFVGLDGSDLSYDSKDLAKANLVVSKYMAKTLTDDYTNDKIYHLAKQARYLTHGNLKKAASSYHSKSKHGLMDVALSFYSIPEEWNALSVMVAQLMSLKTKSGKSAFDSYEVVNGELVWTGGVRGIVKDNFGNTTALKEITSLEFAKMRRVYERSHGQYREDEKAPAEAYWLGNLMMTFSRHMATYFRNNWGAANIDLYQGTYKKTGKEFYIDENGNMSEEDVMEWVTETNRGRWKLLFELFLQNRKFNELTDLEKKTTIEAATHALTSVLLVSLISIFMGMGADDDDEETPIGLMFEKLDTEYYSTLFPTAGILEVGKDARSGNLVSSYFTDLTYALWQLSISGSSELLGINKGDNRTEDGTLKGLNKSLSTLPFTKNIEKNARFVTNDKSFKLSEYLSDEE